MINNTLLFRLKAISNILFELNFCQLVEEWFPWARSLHSVVFKIIILK
jgi:hypothetical protein